MDQTPKANKKMAKGDTIRIVISLGPQPAEKVMVDLSHVPQEQAENFLNAMELNLQFLPKMENSSTVEKGCVIREALDQGKIQPTRYQSYVRLYEQAKAIPDWQRNK